MMNCDNCRYYEWYYDYCSKWKCQVDSREVHDCFKPRENNMANKILKLDFSDPNKLVAGYEVVDEEPEETTLKYSDFEECHSGNAAIWSPLVWQLRYNYGLYRK